MTNKAITNIDQDRQILVGAAADYASRLGVFSEYQMRRAKNTLRRQRDDLATFAEYLTEVQFYTEATGHAEQLTHDAEAWANLTKGLID